MEKASFLSIGLGVETFSDRLLKCPSINKKGLTSADSLKVIDAMLSTKIVPQINIIIGIPESTPDELADTLTVLNVFLDHNMIDRCSRR